MAGSRVSGVRGVYKIDGFGIVRACLFVVYVFFLFLFRFRQFDRLGKLVGERERTPAHVLIYINKIYINECLYTAAYAYTLPLQQILGSN